MNKQTASRTNTTRPIDRSKMDYRRALTLLIFLSRIYGISSNSVSNTCLWAREACTSRIGCSMALLNVNQACDQEKLGIVDRCTDNCMRAIVSLVTVEDRLGIDYISCDCQGIEDCVQYKSRLRLCSADVMRALETLDNDQVISCNLARMLCEAETNCYTSLVNYDHHCKYVWTLDHHGNYKCTERCKQSLHTLRQQHRAKKMNNCQCMNSDPFVGLSSCRHRQNNTDVLCYNTNHPQTYIPVADHVLPIDGTDKPVKADLKTAAALSQNSRSSSLSITSSYSLTFPAAILLGYWKIVT